MNPGPFFGGLFECGFAVVRFRDCGLFSACGSEMAAQRSDRRTSDINPLFANTVRLLPADHGSTLVIVRQTFAKIGQARGLAFLAGCAPSLGGTATTDARAGEPGVRAPAWSGKVVAIALLALAQRK
jgi:hypothetical protein